MGDYYSYKRISNDTERQNFNRQIKSLERYAAEHNIEYLLEFTEEKSAKSFDDRPGYSCAMGSSANLRFYYNLDLEKLIKTNIRSLLSY